MKTLLGYFPNTESMEILLGHLASRGTTGVGPVALAISDILHSSLIPSMFILISCFLLLLKRRTSRGVKKTSSHLLVLTCRGREYIFSVSLCSVDLEQRPECSRDVLCQVQIGVRTSGHSLVLLLPRCLHV